MSDQNDAGTSGGYWVVGRRPGDGKMVRIAHFETRAEALAFLKAMRPATTALMHFYLARSARREKN